MNQKNTLLAGIIFGGLGVVIGAFGAHALNPILAANNRLDTYEIAVRYQFYHALALLAIGILMDKFSASRLGYAALFIVLGVIIFSGSLYVLSLTGETMLGAVTPFGGLLMIIGWALFLMGIMRKSNP
ncbi:MAG TPA: DUF423 domain-containing protein [Cyclobacteriaceae bacterium]|jgi:uncharacterized membrane protein YgdD (TMEM256/DUF423 family)|nr:DUF423 domain-containing protein [Cyclobacteriaceae bacterium]